MITISNEYQLLQQLIYEVSRGLLTASEAYEINHAYNISRKGNKQIKHIKCQKTLNKIKDRTNNKADLNNSKTETIPVRTEEKYTEANKETINWVRADKGQYGLPERQKSQR